MRIVNLIAYNWFVSNVGKRISPAELEQMTEIKGAGGAAGIINNLRTSLGLNILAEKSGRNVMGYWLVEAPKTMPLDVRNHVERQARIAANKEAKASKKSAPAVATKAVMATEVARTVPVAPTVPEIVAGEVEKVTPVAVSKAAQRAARQATKTVAEAAIKAAREAVKAVVHATDGNGNGKHNPAVLGEVQEPKTAIAPVAVPPTQAPTTAKKKPGRKKKVTA